MDASVIIGLLDRADAHHAQAVEDVEIADRDRRSIILPASAYSEALVAFARADRVTEAREAIASMGISVVPLTAKIAEAAAELRARHQHLRLPDAMVLATARALNAGLLSYDHRLTTVADLP